MAARGAGTSRVLSKLKASIESKNYYEAHQMYRTIYFRYTSQKKYDELLDLLLDGAIQLLNLKQFNSGADLANLFVDVLIKSQTPVDLKIIENLGHLHSLFAPNTPERLNFVARALEWSSNASSVISAAAPSVAIGDNNSVGDTSSSSQVLAEQQHQQVEHTLGHPELHRYVAINYWKEKNYSDARYHFVHSTDGEGCAAMLVELHTSRGYPSEVDLFIAQVVFQYLCLRNKSTAVIAFSAYTKRHPSVPEGPPYLLPLLNFLWFLLLAIERGKLAIFTVLCEQYQSCLKRDPSYREYLDKIGQIFFGLPPPAPKQQGGILGNLLNSLMNGLEEDDGDSSLSPLASTSGGNSSRKGGVMKAEDLD